MISITRYLFLLVLLATAGSARGQGLSVADSLAAIREFKPEFRRLINHEAIDRVQSRILQSDGRADGRFTISANEEVNFLATDALTNRVDLLQYRIERDSVLDHRLKVQYLKGLENMLRYFEANWKNHTVNPSEIPQLIGAYSRCMGLDREGKSVEPEVAGLSYGGGMTLLAAGIFDRNPGYTPARNDLLRKYCALHPDQILTELRDNPEVPFFDSLIKVAAYRYPNRLYDYAAARNQFGYQIRRISDPLIQAISRMALSNSGQLYFPFLDNIVKGRMTIDLVDAVKDDSIRYYQLLVRTHLDYVRRAINHDTAYGYRDLTRMMAKKAEEVFVNTINGLHEVENPAVRFHILQGLSAEDLYYLAVLTDGVIYTSSFVNGVYPLMMSRIGHRADSLLMLVQFDRYRKFIKMSAAYNTLGDFLRSFPHPEDAKKLMQAFVTGLEKTSGLEDGVDVADSYASIFESNRQVANEMVANVQYNYLRNLTRNNRRGIVMYDLLYKLFLSADSTKNIDLSKEFGIPPVYTVSYKSLADSSGRVIMQVFFYGDKDGQGIFRGFLTTFSPANWKIDYSNPQWVTVTSLRGRKVSIYANRPLPEEKDEDAKAQEALDAYLQKNRLYPTITIHRGHSYYAPYTIDQMAPTSKIVFMGSCGGYHLIHDILKKASDAHIIASKQIGKTAINRPFFEQLMETVRAGNNIDWIPFWQELSKKVKVEGFEDYIPPYKNLGALFIKAYKKAMGDEEDEGDD
ncbi:MAG TPA: hypothetical protein VG870_10325 [Chitinophagaceae bacterium]|nr:hypothetical protein [Chitinophagaceae bacterium]